MFVLKLSATTLALSLLTSVSALVVLPRDAPAGYAEGYLEDYDTYHARYIALGCQYNHGNDFFNTCCHPLLATESLSSLPSYCTPSSSSSSAEATTSAAAAPVENIAVTTSSSSTWSSSSSTTWWPTSTTSADDSSSTSSSSSSVTGLITGGFGTYFYQNGVAGACGTVHSDSDYIIAIDTAWYGNTGATSQYCGKQIKVTNTANQKSVVATVADACPTCNNGNSLDLSVGAFGALADLSVGLLNIDWQFV